MSNHSQNSKEAFRSVDLTKGQMKIYNFLDRCGDTPACARDMAILLNTTEHSITGRLLELRKKGIVIIDNSKMLVYDRNYYRIRKYNEPIEVFKPTPSQRIKELEEEVKRLKDKYEPERKFNKE